MQILHSPVDTKIPHTDIFVFPPCIIHAGWQPHISIQMILVSTVRVYTLDKHNLNASTHIQTCYTHVYMYLCIYMHKF